MMDEPLAVQLEVRVDGREVTADLVFTNRDQVDVGLYRVNACENGEVENDLFEIERDGEAVDYIGILAKRREPTAEDFITLEPGESFHSSVRLDTVYEFADGAASYVARYSALNPLPDGDGFFDLESREVAFRVPGD